MHKQVIIIGAGPSGLLLARMLHNRGVDCLILENRNESFLRELNRGGFLEKSIVQTLEKECSNSQLREKGMPLTQIEFNICGEKFSLSLPGSSNECEPMIYDQKNLVRDLLEGVKTDEIPIIFEAKGQRYEGLDSDKVRVIYTLNGQLYDMTCDYVVGCDGFRGISRRSIPKNQRTEHKEELEYAWLEWMVDDLPASKNPLITFHKNGLAMQSPNANGQTRYYMQVERGTEISDLPDQEVIWQEVETRLGKTTKRGATFNRKLDYMRSFYTDKMQYGRLFIAGDAAHQVPRLGSKGLNMALADAALLAQAFDAFYNFNNEKLLKKYTSLSLDNQIIKLKYTNFLNQIFHKHKNSNTAEQVQKIKELLTEENKKQELIEFLIG